MAPNALITVICTFTILACLGVVLTFEPLRKTDEKKLSFRPPDLTEEESKSRFVPASFKCDACKAIAFQFFTQFDTFNQINKKYKYEILESDLLDLSEGICHHDSYNYGVKEIAGEKKLSGDGLQAKDIPGILAGGGMWPARLSLMCSRLIEELSEEDIYNAYKEQPDDIYYFQNYLCFGSGIRNSCAKKVKAEL